MKFISIPEPTHTTAFSTSLLWQLDILPQTTKTSE